jgi:hypothetical protein
LLPPVGCVQVHPEITPPSNFHHLRDTTSEKDLRVYESTEDQVRRVFEDAGITFLHLDKGEGVLIDVTKAKKAK